MKQVNLRDIAEISSGRALKGGLKKAEDGTLIVTMADVSGDTQSIDWENVDRGQVSLRSHKPIKNGDILFLAKGKQFKAIPVDGLEEVAIATSHFFIIRPHENIDSHYLALQLNGQNAQQYFAENARGETKKHITRTVMDECHVATCATNTQKTIVDLTESLEHTFKEVAMARALLVEALELFTMGLHSEAESQLIKLQSTDHWGVFEADATHLQSLIALENIESSGSPKSRKPKLL